ncbi:hypothetical protein [Wenyingzhuangia sp. 2_MG-2023]|uniref:hypothetical protein n=1 Tax=Wenyingzhuangia sp. 2_MG-2023 TaxID=3062639 RepID=UPI0026E25389|nr:hypothetical protein [Wenyingzhuangia sp. 2_MG-2023]MDO6739206.1 hypothetical protein [Wenyingzhuangia sp. 2_MG-2023]MDO6803793.1 hypothetical protein [Wenyingzhuangia sp. 1_MG-2023]
MEKINSKTFIKQLFVKDLFGKDSHRGVSLTYAWLANQLGHFTLGFFPSIVLSLVFKNEHPPIYYSIIVASVWAYFEVFNLVLPLFFAKKDMVFKPKWSHLIFDTITDVLYFALGAMVSCVVINPSNLNIKWVSIILLVLLFYPFIYWYTTRIYQQYAYFPFQYRLSQWKGEFLDDEEKQIVETYVKQAPKSTGNHILIYGSVNEGKSNLGVAIANELALKKQTCTYTTATKLYSLFHSPDQINNELLWTWNNCKFLVIDDITPDKYNTVSHNDFLKLIDTLESEETKSKEILKNKNVIWILGVNKEDEKEEWSELLETIGVPNSKISIVNLSY